MTVDATDLANLADQVNQGAQWLDTINPGWHTQIDLGTLAMENPCKCILGQTGIAILEALGLEPLQERESGYWRIVSWEDGGRGTYRTWATDHSFSYPWATDHGFATTNEMWERYGHDGYSTLEDLWIAAIKTRYENG